MTDPFVVVGGDAAGLSAASKAKREASDREVIVFEKGEWVSFAHCGMPYYVKGEVDDLEDLLSLRPDEIVERGIDLRRNHEVVDLDPASKTVQVVGPDGSVDQTYGDLLLGTGARALAGPFDDALAMDGVFTLHHMDSAAAIRAFLADPATFDPDAVDGPFVDRAEVRHNASLTPPNSAAIVGGGYVGVEMAEALVAHDLDVHLFQRSSHLLPAFGPAVGEIVEGHLREQGVTEAYLYGADRTGQPGTEGLNAFFLLVDEPETVSPDPLPVPGLTEAPTQEEQEESAAAETPVDPEQAEDEAQTAETEEPSEPAADPRVLELTFNEQSWTEIFDANNRRVFVGLQEPGTTARVEGEPPFRLTVGNATGVELVWRGECVDLGARAGANNVARFTLGE
jgi:hypothetical protein